MKTMFLAAAAVLSLGVGSAFAQTSPTEGGYVYPDYWATQTAQQSAPKSHPVAQSDGDAIGTYVTHTQNDGTWLFPPDPWQ